MARHRNAQSAQQLPRLGLGLPAVEFAEFGLQLRRPHPVGLVEVRLGVERVLLLHDLVQPLVSHQHGGQRIEVVVREVILLQHRHPQTRGNDHRA